MYNRVFNLFTPKSTPGKIVLPSTGSVYLVSRISNKYSSEFPPELEGRISRSQFLTMMLDINDVLEIFWPCSLCWVFSHLMMVFSFGLSILIPLICISRLETELKDLIKYNNRELRKKGLMLHLRKKYFSSWLEIRVLKDDTELDWEEGIEQSQFSQTRDFLPRELGSSATRGEFSDSSSEDYDAGSQECKQGFNAKGQSTKTEKKSLSRRLISLLHFEVLRHFEQLLFKFEGLFHGGLLLLGHFSQFDFVDFLQRFELFNQVLLVSSFYWTRFGNK